jgi:predicted secreted protein
MKRTFSVLFLCLMFCAPSAAGELIELPGPPMDDAMWEQLLLGSWCEDPSVASGYGERWVFTRDALYILPRQYGEGETFPAICMWKVADDALWISPDDCGTPFSLSGPYEVPAEEASYTPKILIDGKTLYQYSPDPSYFEDLGAYGIAIEESIGSPKAIDALDEGAVNHVMAGQSFTLEIPENQTTPYRWALHISDEACVALDDEMYLSDPNPEGFDGVGGTHIYRFEALAPGTCTIALRLTRISDEDDIMDERVFHMVVDGG